MVSLNDANISSSGGASDADPFRVLIVDDSAVIRGLITRACEGEKSLKVVATASNGDLAVKALQRDAIDVIVLDIEMPIMDGISALPLLKAVDPAVQIVMASTLTLKNAEISLKALSLGATDYLPKPTSTIDAGMADFKRELVEKIIQLGAIARRKGVRRAKAGTAVSETPKPQAAPKPIILRTAPFGKPDIIALGSSTGGPQALFQVIKDMGGALRQPVVITQHMPPSFTAILAEHICRQCKVDCVEAKDGDLLKAGHYYVAPGDFHMLAVKGPEGIRLKLVKDPPENYCRPAVDPMLRSLVDCYGGKVLVAILTGMGQDGREGAKVVTAAGGCVIAQDEASSVVWGMPGAVATAGLCHAVQPLLDIGNTVKKIADRGF